MKSRLFPVSCARRASGGASLGHFASNYNFYFILAWLPEYLVRECGFSMQGMATVAGIAYLINATSALGAGWAVAAWTRSGRSPNAFYKSIMAFAHLVSMGTMVGMVLLPIQGSIACLCLFQFAIGVSSPGTYAIPQIIAGPLAAGRWVGVQNACGNLAGVFAPAITGLLLDATGTFLSAFVLAGAINVLGLVGWLWMLPRIEPLNWIRVARAARGGKRVKRLGSYLIMALEAQGVRHVFGIPGVHNLELYRGLTQSRIKHVSGRHELALGFMADGYARVSGRVGVCFTITGPGLTNIATPPPWARRTGTRYHSW